MKKALIFLSAIVMLAAMVGWIVSSLSSEDAVAASAAKPWPGGMGTIDSVLERYPPIEANAASAKLTTLAGTLPVSQPVTDFVSREIARDELTIGEPPALPDVSAIRELLLREPLVWQRRHVEIGDADTEARRVVVMTVSRSLVANALAKARTKDPTAWEELHAAWKLARTLDGHPQTMLQTAALSIARMVNAVAWKMPLPAPPWLDEVRERDHLRPLLEAFQHQSASYWEDSARLFPTKWLATSVEHDRRIAEELFNATRCDVSVPMNELGTDLTPFWRRAFRYRVEREATANALRVREGKPIESTSRCSDGAWTFDGTTLRFTGTLPAAASEKPMPLVLRLAPGAQD